MQKDYQARNLNREDAVSRGRWKKLVPAHPDSPRQRVVKWLLLFLLL